MVSPESHHIQEDDTPERIEARIRLIEKIVYPVARWIIDAFPAVRWRQDAARLLLQEYKFLRDQAKLLMDNYDNPDHMLMIDRHKIAAAFIMAILKVRPLENIKPEQSNLEISLLVNEILAFQSAVRILGAFAKHEASFPQDAQKALEINYPAPQASGAYKHHAYRALRHGYREEKLNLPILAHWMFYIEKYWQLNRANQSSEAG